MKKIFIASDHAGFDRKKEIISWLTEQDFFKKHPFTIVDLGPQDTNSVDFPDFANLVCNSILSSPTETSFGILICGSGQGMAMRANKFAGIRAALCWSEESAQLSREHNNANVLCFGARLIALDTCKKMVSIFLQTNFAGGRHLNRVAKINAPV